MTIQVDDYDARRFVLKAGTFPNHELNPAALLRVMVRACSTWRRRRVSEYDSILKRDTVVGLAAARLGEIGFDLEEIVKSVLRANFVDEFIRVSASSAFDANAGKSLSEDLEQVNFANRLVRHVHHSVDRRRRRQRCSSHGDFDNFDASHHHRGGSRISLREARRASGCVLPTTCDTLFITERYLRAMSPKKERGIALMNTADYFKEQVVIACRVVAREGYADLTLGHVSVLDPDTQTVYIKRKGPGLHEIEPEHVLMHPLYDDAALKTTPNMHFEAVLHTEIYKRYPGARAVIHSHPPYATALSASSTELRMVNHDSLLFADGLARFDEFRLITEPSEGQVVAEALGDRRAILLNNHGVVVTGESIGWAVLTAVTLERAIRVQMIAESLGNVREIPLDLAKEYMSIKYKDNYVEEYWASWVRDLRRTGYVIPKQASFG